MGRPAGFMTGWTVAESHASRIRAVVTLGAVRLSGLWTGAAPADLWPPGARFWLALRPPGTGRAPASRQLAGTTPEP